MEERDDETHCSHAASGIWICGDCARVDRSKDTISVGDTGAHAAKDRTTAAEIMAHVETVYKACKSYCDTGVVRMTVVSEDGKLGMEHPFTTVFVRPDRFRFEYSFKFPFPGFKTKRHIIWAKGSDVRTWWDIQPGVRKDQFLGMALAAATGVSGGSAHTVPALLMPQEVCGFRVTELQRPERIEDAQLDDVACYRVQGTVPAPGGEPMTLWISKETFLIRRIDSTDEFPKTDSRPAFQSQTTTTYTPQTDVAIEENKLALNWPDENGD